MLQIFLYGPVENGYIDVNPETVLNMEGLTEIFDEDLSVGEFSVPVEIPWTPLNRRLFGFAERLENFSSSAKFFRCDVYDRNFPELLNAKLTILERSGNFSYTKGSFSASISGTRGLYGSTIKGKTLADLQLGGKISWADDDSRMFARKLMMGDFPQYNHIAFAPVVIEGFIQKDRPDYDGEFLAMDCVNNVIQNGSSSADWTFGRPNASAPSVAVSPGTDGYQDYRTVPFFRVKYIIKKCFEEFGFSVSGAFLDNADFDDLFQYNNRGIESYTSSFIDTNRSITPSNHVPDVSISDYLKAYFQWLNVYPVFTGATDVRLYYRAGVLVNKTIVSLTKLCAKTFTSTFQETDNKSGYKLAFQWDGADNYHSDRVKDITDKTLVATVATRTDLDTLTVGFPLTTDHIAFVVAENLYYQVANATSTPVLWDAYAEALNDVTVGDGDRSVEPKLSPLCTYVEFSQALGLFQRKDYVGCRMPGSYRNNRGVVVKADFGISHFYIQKRSISGALKPVSFNHNRDKNNNKLLPYSLSWTGADGIAKNFHESWQAIQESGEVVKTDIAYNQKVRSDIAAGNVVEINSVLFLPYKIERSIPMKNNATLYLMPL